MKSLLLFALGCGLVLGCYSTMESFDHRMAKLGCINARECRRAEFDATYDSMAECTDNVAADLDTGFAGCTYVASRGRDCVHATYKLRKNCDLFAMGQLPECQGVLTCTLVAPADDSLTRRIVHGFVSPGVGAPDAVPLEAAEPLDLVEDE